MAIFKEDAKKVKSVFASVPFLGINELRLFGKATQDGTPTPDAPVEIEVAGSSGSIEVKSCGKNLLPYPYYSGENQTDAGVVFTSDDGSIKAVGASTTNQSTYTLARDLILPKGTFLKTKATVGILVISRYTRSTLSFDAVIANNDITSFDTSDWDYEKYQYRLLFQIEKANGEVDTILYPMISKEGGEYEPYTETTSTIETPNGLAGIPVSRGGNYTDSGGQQWICDEIVKYADGTGEYIQRVKKYVFDDTVSFGKTDSVFSIKVAADRSSKKDACICSNHKNNPDTKIVNFANANTYLSDGEFALRNSGTNDYYIVYFKNSSIETTDDFKTVMIGAELYYELAEPIHTPLTAEQIAEIGKMKAFYPNTNITNDSGCDMNVDYKYYTEKKKIISMLANKDGKAEKMF